MGCQSRVDGGVYLISWEGHDPLTGKTPVSRHPAREPILEVPGKTGPPQNKPRYRAEIPMGRLEQIEAFPETTRSDFYDPTQTQPDGRLHN